MTPAALAGLAGLAEARKSRDLAQLEGLLAEDRRVADGIAALAETPARDLAEAPDLSLAQQALRARWADQRIRALRQRRTELAVTIRAARAAAVQSLGKHRALADLVERADRELRRARAARTEGELPPAGQPPA